MSAKPKRVASQSRMDPSFTRDVRPPDYDAIDVLLEEAFGGPDEAKLVRALREQKSMFREVIMPSGATAAGYLAVSRFTAPEGWLCLAPVAVHPTWQGGGRGMFMVQSIVEECVNKLQRSMVVLGDGKFYRRCGFLATRAARLNTPYGTQNTLLAAPGMSIPTETLIYPKPFTALG
jgi:putative acetyltransferase